MDLTITRHINVGILKVLKGSDFLSKPLLWIQRQKCLARHNVIFLSQDGLANQENIFTKTFQQIPKVLPSKLDWFSSTIEAITSLQ